jgi:hypothetical protein
VVDVDAIITDAERVQAVALGGEILLPCRYACVTHQEFIRSPAMTLTGAPRQVLHFDGPQGGPLAAQRGVSKGDDL